MKLTPKARILSLVSLVLITIQRLFQRVCFRDTGARLCFLFDSVLPDFSDADAGDFIVDV